MAKRVRVFFYGSYINLDVLREVDLVPQEVCVARVLGLALTIAPRANLRPEPGAVAWGILCTATHAELARLYDEHAHGRLGERYWPEAVLAEDEEARLHPALTYLSHDMVARPAEAAYVERIAVPAEALGFPEAYVDHIRSHRP